MHCWYWAAHCCGDSYIGAPMLTVPPDVYVEYVDFFHHFYSVAFSITLDRQEQADDETDAG